MADNSAAALISAISGLWKLVAAIAVPFIAFLFRKPLLELLPKLKKVKRGNTEIELQERAPSSLEAAGSAIQGTPSETGVLTPGPKTSEENPLFPIAQALLNRNLDEAEKRYQELFAKEPEKRRDHEIFYLTLRCDFLNDSRAAAKLEELKSDRNYQAERDNILHTLGRFYQATEQYTIALERYREAEQTAGNPRDKATGIVGQSHTLVASGKHDQALSLLVRSVPQFSEHEVLARLYNGLAHVHEKLGNGFERAMALEKVAQFRATDTDALFAAAYAQSKANLPYLSLHNYSLELTLDPTQALARNNYGVQLGEFDLPIKSVEQYRRAQQDGNTLAMANLAYLYIEKGLADDAERVLREARKDEGYHANVDRALAKLREDRDQEEEKLNTIENQGGLYQTFVRSFAEGFLLSVENNFSFAGQWKSSEGEEVSIQQDGAQFTAAWGKQGSRTKLTGHQTNRAARGKLLKERPSLLSAAGGLSYSDPKDVLMLLSEDNNTISVLSLGKQDVVHFVFTREGESPAKQ